MNIDSGTATIAAAIFGGLMTVQTMFIKWLVNSFAALRKDIREITENSFEWLIDHEAKDQHRHEENLGRFERISVALARLGSDHELHAQKKEIRN